VTKCSSTAIVRILFSSWLAAFVSSVRELPAGPTDIARLLLRDTE
jgi:hypothetical protein